MKKSILNVRFYQKFISREFMSYQFIVDLISRLRRRLER